jgi:hypothetical protein
MFLEWVLIIQKQILMQNILRAILSVLKSMQFVSCGLWYVLRWFFCNMKKITVIYSSNNYGALRHFSYNHVVS